MKTFLEFLQENSLGQYSRSHKKISWDAYVVSDPNWRSNTYEAENNANIIDKDKKVIGDIKKGDQIQILSLELMSSGKSKYANIMADDIEGFLPITAIRKPTTKIINTKELTPALLGLEGRKFTLDELVAEIPIALDHIKISDEMRDHLLDCVGSIVNKNLFEDTIVFEKNIKLSQTHELSPDQIKLISKNFGEVLGAIFLLKTNKKAKFVEFPKGNQGLYDFIEYSDDNRKVYYSIKSGKGSIASLKNLGLFLSYMQQDYSSEELDKIKTLIAGTKERGTTVDIILRYINKFESDIADLIIQTLDLKELSFDELTKWRQRSSIQPPQTNVALLKKIYDKIGYNFTTITTKSIMGILMRPVSEDKSNNGLIVFPLGMYIIRKLNSDEKMLAALNSVLNFSFISSRVLQSNVDVDNSEMSFKLMRFKNKNFIFGYSATMNDPSKNAMGFIET